MNDQLRAIFSQLGAILIKALIVASILIVFLFIFIVLQTYETWISGPASIGLVTPCYMPWERGLIEVDDTLTVVYGFYGGIMLDDCYYQPTPYLQLKASDPSIIKLLPKPAYNHDRRGRWDSYQKLVAIRPGKADIYLHYTKLFPRKYKIGSLRVQEKQQSKPTLTKK
ncbi:MAG TPA: hypothetical protein PLO56_15590 [Rhodothermales bacterium]|nr:hypothetical protein [Rhodothermales bacterium]